jgi:hypothetical protein
MAYRPMDGGDGAFLGHLANVMSPATEEERFIGP